MVIICQTCGDKGFSEALAICDGCQKYAVHRYCLEVVSYDPIIWYCDDCDPLDFKEDDIVEPYPSTESNDSLTLKRARCSLPEVSDSHNSEAAEVKQPIGGSKKNNEGEMDATNLKRAEKRGFDDELVSSHSTRRPDGQISVDGQQHQGSGSLCHASRQTKDEVFDEPYPSTESNDSHTLKRARCSFPGGSDSHYLGTAKVTPLIDGSGKNNEGEMNVTSMKRAEKSGFNDEVSANSTGKTNGQISVDGQQHQGSSSVYHPSRQTRDEVLDEKPSKVPESNNTLPPLPVFSSSNRPIDIDYVPALPIKNPIWRGNIKITSQKESSSCGIVAHLSRLACSRAGEEAMLFPETLSFELHPRTEVWPKGFDKFGAKDDDIALYFFPQEDSDEKVFRALISEMIRCDSAIKAVVANAELLVFSSTKLPLCHWRFRGKLYLWGVFKKKQDSPGSSSSLATAPGNISKGVGSGLDSAIPVISILSKWKNLSTRR